MIKHNSGRYVVEVGKWSEDKCGFISVETNEFFPMNKIYKWCMIDWPLFDTKTGEEI